MKSVISFADVSLRKNGQAILENINWDINSNEHWAILGLNGSGKTSLLNIISGYHFPSTGDVSVLGNKFGKTSLPELRKKIGFVSSSLDRFSQLVNNETIEEVVVSGKFASFGLYEYVSKKDYKKAFSLIELMRLNYLKGKSFQFLSQGEKRRVLIARALMSNPEILILDEPCSGLDILSREQLLDIMKEVIQKNCHIIYVTHHIEELVKELTHVLLIHNGKIVAAGPKKEVLIDTKLSETFEVPVKVIWNNDRPSLSI
ncbi:ABC transporter ATP-binding protein [Sporosarcina sp. FA9]|uniref:ABC transporter ATP-binding protein n=1 Tax=Sporosarcina sp. FA9 TaxID=3413030 RepID=UPI003F65E4BD